MKGRQLAYLAAFGFGLSVSSVIAQDANSLIIYKKDGSSPKVTAQSVDQLGASKMYELLGEEYLVLSPKAAASLQAAVGLTKPIPLAPGTTPPITPLCQCPEDYRANLDQRFSEIELETLLQPQTNAAQMRLGKVTITPGRLQFLENFSEENTLTVPAQ